MNRKWVVFGIGIVLFAVLAALIGWQWQNKYLIWQWISDNRAWFLSGIGVLVVSIMLAPFKWLGGWLAKRFFQKAKETETANRPEPPLKNTDSPRDKASVTQTAAKHSQNVIVGDGASVGGGVHIGDNRFQTGNIQITVDKWNTETVHQHFGSDEEQTDPAAMRKAYLSRLLCDTNLLSLEGIDPKAAGCDTDSRLNLSAVYTALMTRSADRQEISDMSKSSEIRLISALEFANRHRHAVLLGAPGSGKTTFVNFLALCLAGEGLGDNPINLGLLAANSVSEDEESEDEENDEKKDKKKPQIWEHGALLPVRVLLRDFAAKGLPEVGQKAGAKNLWKFISGELESAELGKYVKYMYKELHEKGGVLILDGLDEVPEADNRRVQIRQVVEDCIKTFRLCRVLVTSRTYAYQKQDWRISGLSESELAPFGDAQIRCFVDRWYAHFAELKGTNPDDAQGKAEVLKRAIFASSRLKELAERPLLLTLMASLHSWRGGSLPEKREELYAATADLLLDRWERPKIVHDRDGKPVIRQTSLIEWLRTDRDKMRNMLNELAYNAHAGQPELAGTADIAEDDLVRGLWELSENPDANPKKLMEYLRDRTGVLLPRGVKVYSFPHRTFQEYFAACHLTDTNYPDTVAELCRKEPNRWREVCLLAGAKAAGGGEFAIWSLTEALCYREPGDPEADIHDIWGAQIAGQALRESANLKKPSAGNQKKLDRVRRWLLRIMEKNLLPATERALAGNNLAKIGDPRFDPNKFYLPNDEELGFVRIPAGEFQMGSDKERDEDARYDEFPQHTVRLSEYWIARYPATVAQFRAFMKDTEYQTDEDWEKYNEYDNHPVVRVSWDDAVVYCKWLTEKLKDRGRQIRLPTEAEWEYAARGADGRIYPWGDEADPDKANYGDTGINTTSAVGCFPGGASPHGISDMSGNVWEWCHDWYAEYPSDAVTDPTGPESGSARVHRGGSFVGAARNCRSADRDFWQRPGNRARALGFRLVREAP
jgi:formylglycine-generating enzyme required for sulfatase activity